MALGLCECGCGQRTTLITVNSTTHGRVKGQYTRFVHGHHNRLRVAFTSGPKRCRRCGFEGEVSEHFYKQATGRSYGAYCKRCSYEISHAARLKRRAIDPERERRENRRNDLKRHYGLSTADYDALLATQGHLCAICGVAHVDRKRARLAVDHCHETGAVRGALCRPCNAGLGSLGDDPERLATAIAYLASPLPVDLAGEPYAFSSGFRRSSAYAKLLAAQDGLCAICGATESGHPQTSSLLVDHDHATGWVRGLLCQCCNFGIGAFRDSSQYLEGAITYLERGLANVA